MDKDTRIILAKQILMLGLRKRDLLNAGPGLYDIKQYVGQNLNLIDKDPVLQNIYLSHLGNSSKFGRQLNLKVLYYTLLLQEEVDFISDFVLEFTVQKKTKFLVSFFKSATDGRDNIVFNGNYFDIYCKFLGFHYNRFFTCINDSILYSENLVNHLRDAILGFNYIYDGADFNDPNEMDSVFFLFYFRRQLRFLSQLFQGVEGNEYFNTWNSIFIDEHSLGRVLRGCGAIQNTIYLPPDEDEPEVEPIFCMLYPMEGVRVVPKADFFSIFWI